jgi:hypothetical protein
MNVLAAFTLAASVAVGISALALRALHGPLSTVLVELCGSVGRARFWSAFTVVTIVLSALFGMLVSFPLSETYQWSDYPQLPVAFSAIRFSLFFLLMALGVLGFVLLLGIGSFEHQRRQDASNGLKGMGRIAEPPRGT